MRNLAEEQNQFNTVFEDWLRSHLELLSRQPDYAPILLQSQSYSLLSGGKRFRPFLAYLVHRLFSDETQKLRSFCLGLEMVHTYSLIHDDLPCMDNDQMRRGQPTNHIKFSEDIALLAGDGMLTDAFSLLAGDAELTAAVRIKLIETLSERIGSTGMVSGQVFDMKATADISLAQLEQIHRLKTANLIQAAAVGGALIAGASEQEIACINNFGLQIGMAFQIQDDLLDGTDKEQSYKSYLSLLGSVGATQELQRYSEQALSLLSQLAKRDTSVLRQLVTFNLQRSH